MRIHVTLFCLFVASFAYAQESVSSIQTKTIIYRDGDVTLEGFAAWSPQSATTNVPGILVVHQWMGVTEYEKRRCRELAELGYVAFALDIYGQDIRPENTQVAGKTATIYKSDRELYRRRLKLGFAELKKLPGVASDQTAAIGYCFGGTGVLELARTGVDVDGVVSFHGGLDSPSPNDGKNIRAKVLVCHGADDPFVPESDIKAFLAELNQADVDWQMDSYSNAVHSFTQPMAGDDNSKGAAYNAKADRRSWEAMKSFFAELFSKT